MTFHELANTLCEQLPDGYQIDISCERHAGWVALSNPDHRYIELHTDDMSLEESVLHALATAKNGGVEPPEVQS